MHCLKICLTIIVLSIFCQSSGASFHKGTNWTYELKQHGMDSSGIRDAIRSIKYKDSCVIENINNIKTGYIFNVRDSSLVPSVSISEYLDTLIILNDTLYDLSDLSDLHNKNNLYFVFKAHRIAQLIKPNLIDGMKKIVTPIQNSDTISCYYFAIERDGSYGFTALFNDTIGVIYYDFFNYTSQMNELFQTITLKTYNSKKIDINELLREVNNTSTRAIYPKHLSVSSSSPHFYRIIKLGNFLGKNQELIDINGRSLGSTKNLKDGIFFIKK